MRARGSASIAERLAFAGLDVLYLVTDDQLDARRRLGISESDPDVARVQRGSGSVTVVGLAGAHAMDVLYRSGPGRFGRFDAIMVDTPPVKRGGALPGVLLIAPTDGDDASANVIRMLRATPANTDVVLVRIDAVPKHEWARDAATIHDASNHADGSYRPAPAHRRGPRGAEPRPVGLDARPARADPRVYPGRGVAGGRGVGKSPARNNASAAGRRRRVCRTHPRLGRRCLIRSAPEQRPMRRNAAGRGRSGRLGRLRGRR